MARWRFLTRGTSRFNLSDLYTEIHNSARWFIRNAACLLTVYSTTLFSQTSRKKLEFVDSLPLPQLTNIQPGNAIYDSTDRALVVRYTLGLLHEIKAKAESNLQFFWRQPSCKVTINGSPVAHRLSPGERYRISPLDDFYPDGINNDDVILIISRSDKTLPRVDIAFGSLISRAEVVMVGEVETGMSCMSDAIAKLIPVGFTIYHLAETKMASMQIDALMRTPDRFINLYLRPQAFLDGQPSLSTPMPSNLALLVEQWQTALNLDTAQIRAVSSSIEGVFYNRKSVVMVSGPFGAGKTDGALAVALVFSLIAANYPAAFGARGSRKVCLVTTTNICADDLLRRCHAKAAHLEQTLNLPRRLKIVRGGRNKTMASDLASVYSEDSVARLLHNFTQQQWDRLDLDTKRSKLEDVYKKCDLVITTAGSFNYARQYMRHLDGCIVVKDESGQDHSGGTALALQYASTAILCGDGTQLGPHVITLEARMLGMASSAHHHTTISSHDAFLNRLYRSHPNIVQALQAYGRYPTNLIPAGNHLWKTRSIILHRRTLFQPVVRVQIRGECTEDPVRKSFFNEPEIETAMACVKAIDNIFTRMRSGSITFSPILIRIVTPYSLATEKMQEALQQLQLQHIDVLVDRTGDSPNATRPRVIATSIFSTQGVEADVVILRTTRSEECGKATVGFVSDRHVVSAMSLAKSSVILIGDFNFLSPNYANGASALTVASDSGNELDDEEEGGGHRSERAKEQLKDLPRLMDALKTSGNFHQISRRVDVHDQIQVARDNIMRLAAATSDSTAARISRGQHTI